MGDPRWQVVREFLERHRPNHNTSIRSDETWRAACSALDSLEAELAHQKALVEEGDVDYLATADKLKKAEAELAQVREERDAAVAALKVSPHVGGKPGATHENDPRPLACHACSVLAALTDETEPDNYVGAAGAEHLTDE